MHSEQLGVFATLCMALCDIQAACILIWGLQINFSEEVNSQIWNLHTVGKTVQTWNRKRQRGAPQAVPPGQQWVD